MTGVQTCALPISACDVGQGDALALAVGPRSAIVVDAGPDPQAVDRCLDRLGVEQVPLLVLTHFHADHVDGIDGVLDGRSVGAIETTELADPPGGVELVRRAAAAAGVPVTVAPGSWLERQDWLYGYEPGPETRT